MLPSCILTFQGPALGPARLSSTSSSSPSAAPGDNDLPLADKCAVVDVEATDGPCPSPSPPRVFEIAVSGPRVASARPLVTVFSQAQVNQQDFCLPILHLLVGCTCVCKGGED